MTKEFNFGDDSVASLYDSVLVPLMFDPWGESLLKQNGPWEGKRVLDLATGTGIIARKLVERVGPDGKVRGVDMNAQMLTLAEKRCEGTSVDFIKASAESTGLEGESMDVVVCQQAFQFFPDKEAAAREILRLLVKGGKCIISTWRPVEECSYFGAICGALKRIGEDELSGIMRVPFDYMPQGELSVCFESAGFSDVTLTIQSMDFIMSGGAAQGVEVAYATPIGPSLNALSEMKKADFGHELSVLLQDLSPDGITMGQLVANILKARKPE